ncbi:MAG: ATP-binding cassette domain-containing protein [Actinobacteria bacterium]|uniref:Unannotated protein n=1 Tax=freshwater metagenome TaxID=449393 RepID=A0A6J6NG31_9ZZZZ|nr:ATP-binding cassette domain-containing protein [Actinomycetota bacterium]
MNDLHVTDVTYVVGRPLLDGVGLTFPAGRLTALSGPSGSGKTTLLSIAGGLLQPSAGSTAYAGAPMWRGTGDPRPEVAFVLQVYGLVPILSARENVSIALRARGVPAREADERAQQALARFHIADLGDRQVEELSGGQMQRVALARGLCVGAPVLLADEPTSELDEGNRSLVLAELRREADQGSVVVVATHDPAVVEACDLHFALDEGRLVDHTEPVHLKPVHLKPAAPAPVAVSAARPDPSAPVSPAVPPTADEPKAPTTTSDGDPHSAFRRPGAGG